MTALAEQLKLGLSPCPALFDIIPSTSEVRPERSLGCSAANGRNELISRRDSRAPTVEQLLQLSRFGNSKSNELCHDALNVFANRCVGGDGSGI